ncbi:hypothetical protein Tco_0200995 [Tanacetum coccineum]
MMTMVIMKMITMNRDDDDFVYPKFSTFDKEERHEEKMDEEEEGSDQRIHTPFHFESTDDEAYDEVTQGDNAEEEKLDEEKTTEEEEVNKIYNDVNANLEGRDTKMTNALLANVQATQVIEDTHVIITAVTPEVQQHSSSVSSCFIFKMLNPNPDTGIDSILNLNIESTSMVDVPVTTNDEIPPSFVITLPPPHIPLIQPLQQTPVSTPTIVLSTSLKNLPTFASLFKFKDRVKSLEDDFLKFKQTNLFAKSVSLIPGIVDKYLSNQMNEAVKAVVQLLSDRLRDEAQAKNEDFINKLVNEQLKAEVLIRSSNEAKTSHAVAANLSELELKKILIDKMENNKSIDRSVQQNTLYKALVDAYETDKDILATYGHTVTFKRCRDDEDEDDEPSAGSNQGSKRRKAGKEPESTSAPKDKTSKSTGSSKEGFKSKTRSTGKSAQAEKQVHTVKDLEEPAHQEFETGFTKDHLVDKTSQLPDWFQKPAKPPTPDLDWNKNLPANHGPIQPWISTLAWNKFNELMDTPLDFSAFVLNRLKVDTLTPELFAGPTFKLMKGLLNIESARDVYSRNRIVAIKKLAIVEWHNYKHLDWITVRRDDDKLYTFKEGDYNRLHLEDIEDMLLLLVQDKLTNLNIEEHLALGVSLRMFTRSIVIKRRVEDLQLGIESYQKKLNLTKLDTLMRIDELQKFSDGTLNDVRSALDDILKRIRMEYLP